MLCAGCFTEFERAVLDDLQDIKVQCRTLRHVQRSLVERVAHLESMMTEKRSSDTQLFDTGDDMQVHDVDTQELGDNKVKLPCRTLEQLRDVDFKMTDCAEVQHYVVSLLYFYAPN